MVVEAMPTPAAVKPLAKRGMRVLRFSRLEFSRLEFSRFAQKEPINSRFSAIFEKPVVAGQLHNLCFNSAMFRLKLESKRSLTTTFRRSPAQLSVQIDRAATVEKTR